MAEEQELNEIRKEVEVTRSEIDELRSNLIAKEKHLLMLEMKLKSKEEQRSETLTNEEISRYSRQLILRGFGIKSQKKLKAFSVLIVGAGGLGCPAAQYLAAAGIGKIGIVDYDDVDRTNLHRQILHTSLSIGIPKVESARKVIQELNPSTNVITFNKMAKSENIVNIISDENFDLVLDCTDNVATRYLLNDACVLLGKPLVSGSALQWDGQITVYNYGDCCPCYRCIYPVPPPPESVTNCGDGGVLGPVTGVIGSLQALETIKIAAQLGEVLAGRLLIYDGIRCMFRNIKLRGRRADCNVCSSNCLKPILDDYEFFCGMRATDKDYALNLLNSNERMTVLKYHELRTKCTPHILIDVRSEEEFEICHLPNSLNLPINLVTNDNYFERLNDELADQNLSIFVVCRRGNDSQIAVQHMKLRYPKHDIHDIIGGLHAWHFNIDKNFPIY